MNFITNLVTNWKTASGGVGLILTGLVHIGYCIYHSSMTETDLTTTLMSIIAGFGLLVAADASASAQAHADSTDAIKALNNKVELNSNVVRVTADAVTTGNTEFLRKAAAALPPADPAMLTKAAAETADPNKPK